MSLVNTKLISQYLFAVAGLKNILNISKKFFLDEAPGYQKINNVHFSLKLSFLSSETSILLDTFVTNRQVVTHSFLISFSKNPVELT